MTATYTVDDLALLDRLQSPVWIVDLDRGAQWWANLACLPLWGATDRAEMLARSRESVPSETSRTRLEALRRKFERGETSLDRWTLYPDGGAPFVAECRSSGIQIRDTPAEPARVGMLIEGRLLTAQETDPHDRRGVEALRYLAELVSLYADSGEGLMRNPAAVRVHGDPGPGDQLAASLGEPQLVTDMRTTLATGQVFRADVRLDLASGERWYDTVVRPSLDPVTGQPAILVTQRDVTDRRAELLELEHSRTTLAEQAQALRMLAAPVMRVGPGVLALPLIGHLDHTRIEVALAAVVTRASERRVSHVVLDLTGAEVSATTDDAVTIMDGLLRMVRVLRLQGMRVALSGIRPELAEAIVHAGQSRSGLACFSTLADALAAVDR